jgi:hypothetical protein
MSNNDTIPSPPPTETIPPIDTIPDNPIPEPEEYQSKSTAVTITQSIVNIPFIMVLITIVAVLFSMFYRCH